MDAQKAATNRGSRQMSDDVLDAYRSSIERR